MPQARHRTSTACFDNDFLSLIVQYIKQIAKAVCRPKMLHKRTSQRDCYSNYSQSFPNLHSTPLLSIDFKEFFLKKSLFNPPEGLAQSYAARRHIAAADVPNIEVIHYSKRWLLLQAPRFSRNFFRKLNSGQLGNPYEQLLKIFKSFVALTAIYGFFRPTVGMIFMERRTIRVWISQDIFSGACMIPLSTGLEGEKQFVLAFLAMVESHMPEWERVQNIYSIDEATKMLDWRSKINRNSMTAIQASREVLCHPSQSKASFQPNELGLSNKLKLCQSVREIELNQSRSYFQTELSSSVTIKDQEHKIVPRFPNEKKISGLFSDSKDLKNSYNDMKGFEVSNQVRKTRKKFNLTSTSSTLERFSEKWRSTVGKKAKKVMEVHQPNGNEHYIAFSQQHTPEPVTIQHQFEGLFCEDEEFGGLKLGMEGDRQELEKIAEEIEEVLIW